MEQATKLPLLPLTLRFLTTFLLSLTFLFHVSEHTLQYVIGKCGLVFVFDRKLKYKLRICCDAGRLCAVTDGWRHKMQTGWKEIKLFKVGKKNLYLSLP